MELTIRLVVLEVSIGEIWKILKILNIKQMERNQKTKNFIDLTLIIKI